MRRHMPAEDLPSGGSVAAGAIISTTTEISSSRKDKSRKESEAWFGD
jgi:hypothetical protein